jgi:hypothetical protein
MKQVFSIVTILSAIILPQAFATSCWIPPPEQEFEEASVVVMAFPTAVSDRKDIADSSKHRQTILWTVHATWKGTYKPGDTFTTRMNFGLDPSCSMPIYSKELHLLYLHGREPYRLFWPHTAARSLDHFKHLGSLHEP